MFQLDKRELFVVSRLFEDVTRGDAAECAAAGQEYLNLSAGVSVPVHLWTLEWEMLTGSFVFGPSIDGDIIPDSPHTLLAEGAFAKIPYISGNMKDEWVTSIYNPTCAHNTGAQGSCPLPQLSTPTRRCPP